MLEDGTWRESPLGWCGTGLGPYTLEPGESLTFTAFVPTDGQSYRFSFGEPAIRTRAVSAAPR